MQGVRNCCNGQPVAAMAESVAEPLRLLPNFENTVSVARFIGETLPDRGATCRLREFLVGNIPTQWYNPWITLIPESFRWYRIINIFWRRRQ